jgi:hypothetical protein
MRLSHRSAALLLLLLSACADEPTPTAPPAEEPGAPPPVAALGLYQIEVSGIGSPQMSSNVVPAPAGPGTGARLALAPAGAGLVIEQVSSLSFTEGARGAGGQRYVSFTYRVRNGTGVPLDNLTFLLVSRTGTVPGTSLSALRRFDGTTADTAIAAQVVPTGAVALGSDLVSMQALYPDVIQVMSEAEVAAIPKPGDVTEIFPIGYVARHRSATNTRLLPATTDPNQFDGVVTVSFRLPLQATSASDVFSLGFQILAVTDTERRLTESMEEAQDTAAVRRLRERALALGATTVTVLNGSPASSPFSANYTGQRQICSVRTAGAPATPRTLITNPAAYTRLTLYRMGETYDGCAANFRAGTVLPANYGMPYPVTAHAMDRYGNFLTAAVDTVALTSTDGSATMPARNGLVGGARILTASYTTYGNSFLVGSGRRLQSDQVPVLVNGMTRTWTGDADAQWFTNGSWIQNMHPGVQDSVVIPGDRPVYPLLAQNVTTRGIIMTPGAAVQPFINLSFFDLTVNGHVALGNTGTFTGTGRLILAGVASNVGGGLSNFDVRNLRVTGTYSATSNLNVTGGRIVVQGGRLRNAGYRVRVRPN